MNHGRVCALIALCVIISTLTKSERGVAAQIEVLDQQYFDLTYPDPHLRTTTGITANTFYEPAQSFTVGIDGTLSKIQLFVRPRGALKDDLTLNLYDVVDVPPQTLLASIYGAAGMEGDYNVYRWVTFDLSPLGLHVQPGQVFAVGLATKKGNPWWSSDWWDGPGPKYDRGRIFARSDYSMGEWEEFLGHDQEFRTYVLVPEPSNATPLYVAAGLALGGTVSSRMRIRRR